MQNTDHYYELEFAGCKDDAMLNEQMKWLAAEGQAILMWEQFGWKDTSE